MTPPQLKPIKDRYDESVVAYTKSSVDAVLDVIVNDIQSLSSNEDIALLNLLKKIEEMRK